VRPKRWLLRRPNDDAAARIFCFPYPGAGASMFADWPHRVGPAELCRLQPPGRENRLRESHYGTYENLAEDVAEALAPYLDRPFAFFGHCGGALPGFATTLRLAELGLPTPAVLFVSALVAPHDGPHGRLLAMDDEQLAVELAELTRALGGTVEPDAIELGLSVLRADLDAHKRYHLAEPVRLPGAVTVFSWADDVDVRPELLTGWREYSDQVRHVVLPGHHYSVLPGPPALLAELARDMAGHTRSERSSSTRPANSATVGFS
jgi:surfactin synthase thioesterase subunit